jgi:hypothetical protein
VHRTQEVVSSKFMLLMLATSPSGMTGPQEGAAGWIFLPLLNRQALQDLALFPQPPLEALLEVGIGAANGDVRGDG